MLWSIIIHDVSGASTQPCEAVRDPEGRDLVHGRWRDQQRPARRTDHPVSHETPTPYWARKSPPVRRHHSRQVSSYEAMVLKHRIAVNAKNALFSVETIVFRIKGLALHSRLLTGSQTWGVHPKCRCCNLPLACVHLQCLHSPFQSRTRHEAPAQSRPVIACSGAFQACGSRSAPFQQHAVADKKLPVLVGSRANGTAAHCRVSQLPRALGYYLVESAALVALELS
jgi:hypothetical protein